MANLYSIDINVVATVYIRARTKAEARRIAQGLKGQGIEIADDTINTADGPDFSGADFDDPALPDVSLSSAMTIGGLCGRWVEPCAEGVPDHA